MVKAVTGALVGLLEMERDLPDLIVAARDRVAPSPLSWPERPL